MQVILKKDIPQVGRIGELVKVRDGYARNFLIPRALAVPANPGNVRQFEHHKRMIDFHKKQIQKESQKAAEELKGFELKIERRVNEGGKLFGSLSLQEIVIEFEKKNLKLDRRDIEIETVKAEGTYPVKVRLPGDVFATVSLIVKGVVDAKEAKKAAKGSKKSAKGKKSEETADAVEETEAAPEKDSE